MRMALEKYIPDGETLLAGIHAIAKETNIIGIFDKCICTEYSLRPDENGGIIALRKKKVLHMMFILALHSLFW